MGGTEFLTNTCSKLIESFEHEDDDAFLANYSGNSFVYDHGMFFGTNGKCH